jgi:hypothetical protein
MENPGHILPMSCLCLCGSERNESSKNVSNLRRKERFLTISVACVLRNAPIEDRVTSNSDVEHHHRQQKRLILRQVRGVCCVGLTKRGQSMILE